MMSLTAECVQVSRFSMWDANSSLDCRLISCMHRAPDQAGQHQDSGRTEKGLVSSAQTQDCFAPVVARVGSQSCSLTKHPAGASTF